MKKKRTPPKDRHKFSVWGLRLPPIYRTQIKLLAARNRRTDTEEVKIAIERYLAENELWPAAK